MCKGPLLLKVVNNLNRNCIRHKTGLHVIYNLKPYTQDGGVRSIIIRKYRVIVYIYIYIYVYMHICIYIYIYIYIYMCVQAHVFVYKVCLFIIFTSACTNWVYSLVYKWAPAIILCRTRSKPLTEVPEYSEEFFTNQNL